MTELYRQLLGLMLPEVILVAVAIALIMLGISRREGMRRFSPWVSLASLVVVFYLLVEQPIFLDPRTDAWNTVRVFEFSQFIKLLSVGVGILFVLLAWPTNKAITGNSALDVSTDVPEFFGLLLLSISGLLIVAGANDIILLFLGLELASIPAYIMVSISRPTVAAQEAGVKYFFLGAMAAAVTLFGFSYLYGTTGLLRLDEIAEAFAATAAGEGGVPQLNAWQLLAVILMLVGIAYKMAAVPMHFYVGDVYQGAATPVTAFLSYVPKAVGLVAFLKVLLVAGGGAWAVPREVLVLVAVMAVLTMTAGNVLGLLQFNVKRVLAYSSVAHSGYLLVGVTAVLAAGADVFLAERALRGVLFYLAAYGIMNVAAFGVLMLLPARANELEGGPGGRGAGEGSAESFEDIAGQGRRHPGLGLAMAVACFSLIGLPLTVGFWGKLYLILPSLRADLLWLVIILLINVAISAAYYLRIVATMFLRPEPSDGHVELPAAAEAEEMEKQPLPVVVALVLSVGATLFFGAVPQATQLLENRAQRGADLVKPPVYRYLPSGPADADAELLSPGRSTARLDSRPTAIR